MLSYAIITLGMRAEVEYEGVTLIVTDIVGFSSSFAVNTIPSAALSIAVGAEASSLGSVLRASSVGSIPINGANPPKIKVYLTASPVADMGVQQAGGNGGRVPLSELGVPADGKEFMVFEGFISSLGRGTSMAGTATAVLQLEHWLANLNYASALSASSHPGNPGDMTFPAIMRSRGNSVDASGQTTGTISWLPLVSTELINTASLSDLWGNVFYKWMGDVVKDDPFAQVSFSAGLNTSGDIAPILDAISRLKPGNSESVPLELAMSDGTDSAIIESGIRSAVKEHTENNWVNTTLWGKLVGEWAPDFWFMVVPRVTDALVVPLTGPASGPPWAVIGNEDYVIANIATAKPHRLRGVGIVQPGASSSGLDTAIGPLVANYTGFAGLYLSPQIKTGMLLIKSAPRWLTDTISASGRSAQAEGANGVVQSVIDGPLAAPGDALTEAAILQGARTNRNFLDKFAQQWFSADKLRGSGGEVIGKLRFDIAPGSNVMVEADRDNAVVGSQALQRTYGVVVQVNYAIDVEQQHAHTSLILTNTHTEIEHTTAEDSDTVVDTPPLYVKMWKGASMVPNQPPEKVSAGA